MRLFCAYDLGQPLSDFVLVENSERTWRKGALIQVNIRLSIEELILIVNDVGSNVYELIMLEHATGNLEHIRPVALAVIEGQEGVKQSEATEEASTAKTR